MLICSKCGSEKIYKNGTRNGKQRWECGDCHTKAKPIGLDELGDPEVLEENVKLAKQKQKLQTFALTCILELNLKYINM